MKVFSVKKYEEYLRNKGFSKEYIESGKKSWANKCEGITEKEINEKGYIICNNWMVEKAKSTITLKEFWDSKDRLAIHCWNEKQANVLLKKFDEMGKKWLSGSSYLHDNNWKEYAEKTCYLNSRQYGKIDGGIKEEDSKIYEFKDIEDFKGIYAANGTALGLESKNQSKKEPILDEVEKAYLSAVIKPFIKDVIYICKVSSDNAKEYFIDIALYKHYITLPTFDKNSPMYKGMEVDKDYTLKELGLVDHKEHEFKVGDIIISSDCMTYGLTGTIVAIYDTDNTCLINFGREFDGHNGNVKPYIQGNKNNWWILKSNMKLKENK